MSLEEIQTFQKMFRMIEQEVNQAVIGQGKIVHDLLLAAVAGGNVLLEGAPGLGKTRLAKTLAAALDVSYARIQFTPDLMPTDITGTMVAEQRNGEIRFRFQKGPLFHSIILADEINRASPKTQSALLEAMEEKTVTIGNETYVLPHVFFVLATQNPLEMEGTFPLPEAQLDRFMMKLKLTMPGMEALLHVLDMTTGQYEAPSTRKVLNAQQLQQMRQAAFSTPAAEEVRRYAVRLVMETHPEHSSSELVRKHVISGASLRGAQALLMGAKIQALAAGRYHVTRQDIANLAIPCLSHRLFLRYPGAARQVRVEDIIEQLVLKVE
ncbi:AAA family ATPase [Aneurinibacillus aneurinilyticus]|nr:AAA family ATPase [Aneurinibacillus aneurinilyticus]MED0708289.1 AAA family ATPase [Aneurinibacillus aneurinilyticus]MED0722123.1 AAA family ATPase [Aneurinibacillus aneurinilyticus]MED0733405.1 AAA family ATPase [Aneurinibacillus aneurinilyticus]MED0741341.1 AAA family ATPase [Aneurinibacillus aneurinilyticus]